MENIKLEVMGMSCAHCVKAIEDGLGELSGVRQVTVSLGDGTVRVDYDPSLSTLDTIKSTIEDLGYEVA